MKNKCHCVCECDKPKIQDSSYCGDCVIGYHDGKYAKTEKCKQKQEPAQVINSSELKQLIKDVFKENPEFIMNIINDIKYEEERERNGLSKIVFSEIFKKQTEAVKEGYGELKHTVGYYNRSGEKIIGMPYDYLNDTITVEFKGSFIQVADIISILVNLDACHYDINFHDVVKGLEDGPGYKMIARKRDENKN